MSFDKHVSIFGSAVFLDSAHKKSLSGENASIDLFIAGLFAKNGFGPSSNTSSAPANNATQDLVRGLEQVLGKQKEQEAQAKLDALKNIVANGIAETDGFIASLDAGTAPKDMQEMFVSILFFYSMMCGAEKTLEVHKIGGSGGFEQPIRRNQVRLVKAFSDNGLPGVDEIKQELSKFLAILQKTYLMDDWRFIYPDLYIDHSKPITCEAIDPDHWHELSLGLSGEQLSDVTDDQIEEAYKLNLQATKALGRFVEENQPFMNQLHNAGFLIKELSKNHNEYFAIPHYVFILLNYWGLNGAVYKSYKGVFSDYHSGYLDEMLANRIDFMNVSREEWLKGNKRRRDKVEEERINKRNKIIKIGSVIGVLIITSIYYLI